MRNFRLPELTVVAKINIAKHLADVHTRTKEGDTTLDNE
jgi:hypothetical protein